MKQSKIAITGFGAVSAAGADVAEALRSMGVAERNAGPLTLFDSPVVLPVFQVAGHAARKGDAAMRTLELLNSAVDEALAQSGLTDLGGYRVGICIGTSVACQLNDLDFYTRFREEHSAPMTSVDTYLNGNLAQTTARRLGTKGPELVLVNACSSGTDAIGVAASWLNAGLCDVAIAGGADELNRVPYSGFNALGVASKEPCRPFDANRTGLNLGEGAGVLVLEALATAHQRDADTSLRLLGYGASADAYHLTAPHPEGAGLTRAIETAMQQAGITSDKIGFVNTHGTSTRDNDLVEGRTLKRIFGSDIAFISTKGYTGHTLGAAGGIEAVYTAAALREQWLPASAGFETPDTEIGVSPLSCRTEIRASFALSTSLAFGGNNAAIVIGKAEGLS